MRRLVIFAGMETSPGLILLTGATGYVGGRLLGVLNEAGHHVRCLARSPAALDHVTGPRVTAVRADLTDPATLPAAFAGVGTALYLVHSMGSTGDLVRTEVRAAENFVQAAKAAGVRRIIYLGGLGADDELSPHLASRQAVGEILRGSGIPTIEFRASIIIGSGSLSFEMIRSLVERLPVMVAPRWLRRLAQPIAIEDVLAYLVEGVMLPTVATGVYEIGGAEQVTYQDLLEEYASQRGLRRFFIPVPVLTPRLSSLWLGLVTPLYARVGRKLVDSLRHDTVVHDPRAGEVFGVRPRGYREAITRALRHEDREFAETRWSDARSSGGPLLPRGGLPVGQRMVDSRSIAVSLPAERIFPVIERVGGATGWYYADTLWGVRGAIDLLVGGVGVRRGRRDPERLRKGDAVDWWRVEAIERPSLLRLAAEMRLPGRAWLQFEVTPAPGGAGSTLRQTAIFDPVGLSGRLYWYLLYPVHAMIFTGMLRRIARQAIVRAALPTAPPQPAS